MVSRPMAETPGDNFPPAATVTGPATLPLPARFPVSLTVTAEFPIRPLTMIELALIAVAPV